MRTSASSGFLAPLGYIAVLVVILIIGGSWYVVAHRGDKATVSIGADKQPTDQQKPTSNVKNFYDCFEAGGSYKVAEQNTCVFHGTSFTQPTEFSDDNVRGAASLTAVNRSPVFSLAAQNFSQCVADNTTTTTDDQGQETTKTVGKGLSLVPTTQVLSTYKTSFVYAGVGCSTSRSVIFARQADGQWRTISDTAGRPLCGVIEKYHIPRVLFTASTDLADRSATCRTTFGGSQTIK